MFGASLLYTALESLSYLSYKKKKKKAGKTGHVLTLHTGRNPSPKWLSAFKGMLLENNTTGTQIPIEDKHFSCCQDKSCLVL